MKILFFIIFFLCRSGVRWKGFEESKWGNKNPTEKEKGTNLRIRIRSANLLYAMCEYTFCQNPQQTYRMTQEILVGVLTKDEEWNEQIVYPTINNQHDRTIEMKFKRVVMWKWKPQKNKRNQICRDRLHCIKVLNVGKIIKNGCRFEMNLNIFIVCCSLNANFACFFFLPFYPLFS